MCKQAYLESREVLFKINTIRTSASDFPKTALRCQPHVQTFTVWIDNDHAELLNAVMSLYRSAGSNAFKSLRALTLETDNLRSYSVRELLSIISSSPITIERDLKCPAIGVFTLPIIGRTRNITLRLEHTLLHPAWQIASTATEPLPSEEEHRVSAGVLGTRRASFLKEIKCIYAADNTILSPSLTNDSTTREETLSLIRSRLLPNLLRRFIANRDTILRVASGDVGASVPRLLTESYWWKERSRSGQLLSFFFQADDCLQVCLTDFIAVERGESSSGDVYEGDLNDLREQITELLALNLGDREMLVEVVDDFRNSVVEESSDLSEGETVRAGRVSEEEEEECDF